MIPKRILIVEDEADLAELIAFNLRQGGYESTRVGTGEEALLQVEAQMPDLVILDVMLPDINGMEVCKRLRRNAKTQSLPIVMVTARGEEMDRVIGFEIGADDYIVKPFSPRELVLRISAILRRAQGSPSEFPSLIPPALADQDPALRFGPLCIDVARHRVTVEAEEVPLTALEFRLLLDLALRRGRVQSRDALLERVWGYTPGIETRTVDTHVKRLREKLGAAAHYVETVRGVGYRLREHHENEPSS